MIPPEAVLHFIDQQKRLLRRTYDEAWQRGVVSYEHDDDPEQEPTLPHAMAVAGLSDIALLAARRRYRYKAPAHPDPVRRTVALAGAFAGLNAMVRQVAAVASGTSPELMDAGGDFDAALAAWADANAWRLDAGDSVAWAGEQAGFAEAADSDGMMLYQWVSVGDTRVCSDCELLADFPPMPLGQWPTSPGAGDTTCNAGCRCSWDTWGVIPSDSYAPELSSAQQDLVGTLSDRQAQVLADMLPDAPYLD